MLVAQAFCPKDQDQALRLATWIYELGGCRGHRMLLVQDVRCTYPVRKEYEKSFDSVEVIPFTDRYNQWPQSCNGVFALSARHIEASNPEPWLFLEPDCVPLVPGWLDTLWTEYKEAEKPFLGDYVSVEQIPPHMSGNAIYPGRLTEHCGDMLLAQETAFDMIGAPRTLTRMHKSKYLMHAWKHPAFETWEQVEREIFAFKPEAVLFHASKDGSLIYRLRERKEATGSTLPSVPAASEAAQDNAGHEKSATCDILIKSYPQDYERLEYCLRSIERFARGFRQLVLVVPAEPSGVYNPSSIPGMEIKIVNVAERGEGYLFQQVVKASAHEWTDADYILHIDSDCILTQPITPETFQHEGKPIWYMTPYAQTQTPWQPITEKFLGPPVDYEFMRRFPFLVPRKLHIAIGQYCEEVHGKTISEYILSQPGKEFSEFNALGALAYFKFRDEFHWVDTTRETFPPQVLIQDFSHDPLTEERKAEFEAILNQPTMPPTEQITKEKLDRITEELTAPETIEHHEGVEFRDGTFHHIIDTRDTLVRDTVALLKQLCTAPRHTAKVRHELFVQGVIPKIKAKRRR